MKDDDDAFADKMQTLAAKLGEQMANGLRRRAGRTDPPEAGGVGYEF